MDIKKNNINNTQQIIKILEKILKEEYSDLDNEINNFRINTIDTPNPYNSFLIIYFVF